MRFNSAFMLAVGIAVNPICAAIIDANYVPYASVSASSVTDNKFSITKRMDAGNQEDLKTKLYRLTDDIMSDVGFSIFYFHRFAKDADKYATSLSKLDLEIKQLCPPNENLLKELDFTHKVLREMNEAVQYERIFSGGEGTDYHIAINMIQINLSLLQFFDFSGSPNPQSSIVSLRKKWGSNTPAQFAMHLRSLNRNFVIWQQQFGKNGPVVPPVKALYDIQVQKAALLFERLTAFVPDSPVQ